MSHPDKNSRFSAKLLVNVCVLERHLAHQRSDQQQDFYISVKNSDYTKQGKMRNEEKIKIN